MSIGAENYNSISFSDHIITFESNYVKLQMQVMQKEQPPYLKQTKKRKIQRDEPSKKRPRYNMNAGY